MTRLLSTVYFDTPDQALAKRGIALRIRSIGRRRIQTLKLPAEGPGGLQVQREIETPVSGDRPELDLIADLRLRRLFADGGIAEGLAPLFVTEFERTAWPLRFDGSQIELAFDRGEIRGGSARHALSEIELELKEGRPEHLFELALALHEVLPITLGKATKAARGYALLDGAEPQPAKASPGAAADHDRARRLRRGRPQLPGPDARQRGVGAAGPRPRGDPSAEGRLRRLRALVNAYRDTLAPAAHEFLSRELRWLQQELNPARDWDVFIATTLEPIIRRMPGLEACLEAASELRDLAQERATAALAAPRYTAFLLHCYHWLATGAWAAAEPGPA